MNFFEKLFPENFRFFSEVVRNSSSSRAYIFWGPDGIGKLSFAKFFARSFLCGTMPPCGFCSQCVFEEHPDILVVSRKEGDERLKAEYIREAIRFAKFQPYSFFKFIIFSEAHLMTQQSFSALLKAIEEPKQYVTYILVTSKIDFIPPTILSRCIRVRFFPKDFNTFVMEKLKGKFQNENFVSLVQKIAFANPSIIDMIDSEEEFSKIWEMIESAVAEKPEFKSNFVNLVEYYIGQDREKARKFLDVFEVFLLSNAEKFKSSSIIFWEKLKRARIMLDTYFMNPKFVLASIIF